MPPDITRAETLDKAHGRIETRQIMVSAEVVAHLEWPGAAQVARIWRERRIGDKVSTEIAYFVTSLPVVKAGPDRLLALVRAHWASRTACTTCAMSRWTKIAAASGPAAVRLPPSAISPYP